MITSKFTSTLTVYSVAQFINRIIPLAAIHMTNKGSDSLQFNIIYFCMLSKLRKSLHVSCISFRGLTFPLPANALVVSQPVKLWNPISHFIRTSFETSQPLRVSKMYSATFVTLMILLEFLTPVEKNKFAVIAMCTDKQITNTSVSGLEIKILK